MRKVIVNEDGKKMRVIKVSKFTESAQEKFIEAWDAAGGYTKDLEEGIACSWCTPWGYQDEILVPAEVSTLAEAAKAWWEICEDEIWEFVAQDEEHERELAEEEKRLRGYDDED